MVFGNIFGRQEQPKQPAQSEFAQDYSTSADVFANASFPASNPSPSAPSPASQPAAGPSTGFASQPAPTTSLPTASDTFQTAYDPSRLHPLAGVSDKLDFLQLDDDKLSDIQGAQSVLPSRGWTDDLCVGTGTAYVTGLGIGGAWGLKEGMSRQLGPNTSAKLRLNSILNATSRRGVMLGNSLGVLAIFYNITNSSLDYYRGEHDIFNSMAAAALGGALYRCTAGIRPAALSAGIMAAGAGVWNVIKTAV